jgi:tetratricopeptide (TPR) repeat protein
MRIDVRLLPALLLLTASAAGARDIHYGAVTHPELDSCDRLHWRGQLDESAACYRQLFQSDAPAEIRAEAAWALNDLQTANNLFRQAAAARPDDPGIRVRWADLFADTHQDGEAMTIYGEALAIDEQHAFALLGSARLLVGGFDDEANAFLEPLLNDGGKANGARAAAWMLVARVSLESGNLAQAENALSMAETLLDQGDWPPLELYALRAAADLLNGVTDSQYTAQSLEYNPAYGGIYAVPAHFYVITRRYREAIDLYQKAVDIEPGLAAAHEELGINLLRDNQFGRARHHLEAAYRDDPFSPAAVNTLRLMDSLGDFHTINDPDMPAPGTLPIIMRLHEEEADAIAPYAIPLTRASIEVFTRRYGFELREPVVIEMYPDHEDFAVRTAGMPGIGILGATFGYVVAMDSPSARPAHEFQWGTTLWHEMAHVFTLEATGHLVPRWFSEGASVFEEWQSGPTPGVRIPMSVYNAMNEDLFLPVAELDEGFIRPTYENQVIVSYMQAGLICQFIHEAFGEQYLRDLLVAFGDGLDTAAAIPSVFDISPGEFDDRFEDFVSAEYGEVLGNLEEWRRTQASVGKLIGEEDWQGVLDLAAHQVSLMPGYTEPDSPYVALARAQDALGQREDAIGTLTTFWRQGGYDPAALGRLAAWYEEAGRADEAIDVLWTVTMVDPLDQELHGTLGDLLLHADRPREALREYEVALSMNPHDKATAYYRRATALSALGDKDESRQALLAALDVAPNYRPAQRLLLELMRADEASEPKQQ